MFPLSVGVCGIIVVGSNFVCPDDCFPFPVSTCCVSFSPNFHPLPPHHILCKRKKWRENEKSCVRARHVDRFGGNARVGWHFFGWLFSFTKPSPFRISVAKWKWKLHHTERTNDTSEGNFPNCRNLIEKGKVSVTTRPLSSAAGFSSTFIILGWTQQSVK